MKVLLTNMGIYNYGCEAILRGTTEILSQAFGGDLHYYFVDRYPNYSKKRLADIPNLTIVPNSLVRAGLRFSLRKLGREWYRVLRFNTKHLKNSDCALSMGGDLYTLSTGDIPLNTYGIGEYCYWKSIPYIIWGASIGPFEDRPDRLAMITEHLQKAALILARDTGTVEYLSSKGIYNNVKRVFDSAFLMRSEPSDIEKFLPKNRDGQLLGLNLSPLIRRYYSEPTQFAPEVIRTCETIVQKLGVSVVLIPHVWPPFYYPTDDDLLFLKGVYNGIHEKFRDSVGIVSEDIGAQRMKHLISQCDFYAGARMHSTIAAFSMKVPTISIAYSSKAFSLNQDIYGHQRWVLRIEDFTAASFCQKVSHLLSEADSVRSILEQKIPSIQQVSAMAGYYLKECLEKITASC